MGSLQLKVRAGVPSPISKQGSGALSVLLEMPGEAQLAKQGVPAALVDAQKFSGLLGMNISTRKACCVRLTGECPSGTASGMLCPLLSDVDREISVPWSRKSAVLFCPVSSGEAKVDPVLASSVQWFRWAVRFER